MAEACSLSGLRILTWSHGDSVSVWMSRWCNYTSKNCFLSRANLKEYEVILLASTVCLMKKWKHYVFVLAIAMVWTSSGGPSKLCQFPGHKGPLTRVKSRDVINPAMAKEVFQLFDISVSIGSRKKNTQLQEDFFVIKIFLFYSACLLGYFWLLFFYLSVSWLFWRSSSVIFSHGVFRRDVKGEKLSVDELDITNFDIAVLYTWRISASRGVIKGSSSSELPLP